MYLCIPNGYDVPKYMGYRITSMMFHVYPAIYMCTSMMHHGYPMYLSTQCMYEIGNVQSIREHMYTQDVPEYKRHVNI